MSRQGILSALTVISSLLAGGSTRAEIVQLIAVRDNTLFETENGEISNGSGPVAFVGNTGALNARRALFFFDVMSAVPESSTVQSVELRLHLSNASNSDSTLVEVHRVLADWGEGASNSS